MDTSTLLGMVSLRVCVCGVNRMNDIQCKGVEGIEDQLIVYMCVS